MASFNELSQKKVLGIPLLYVAGGAVVILAVVAWKMKPASTAADTAAVDPSNSTASDASQISDGALYSGLGATSVGQLNTGSTTDTATDAPIASNDSWSIDAVKWISSHESGASATDALRAVNAFLEGADLSTTQDKWISDYIKAAGPPPDGVGSVGKVTQPTPTPTPTEPLTKPTTPTATNIGTTSLTLATKPVSGATLYEWSLNGHNHAHTTSPSYHWTGLRSKTKYNFTVHYQKGSLVSPESSELTVTTH